MGLFKNKEFVKPAKQEWPTFNNLRCYNPDITGSTMYTQKDLVHDMGQAFDYLPNTEVERMVRCFFWMITEGIRTYGYVNMAYFGAWTAFKRKRDMRHDSAVGLRDNWTVVNKYTFKYDPNYEWFKTNLTFKPTINLLSVCSPTNKYWFGGLSYKDGRRPSLFRNLTCLFLHYKQGRLMFKQHAFNKHFDYLGYTDDYLDKRNWTTLSGSCEKETVLNVTRELLNEK